MVSKKFKWIYFARYLREETNSNGYKIGFKALKTNFIYFLNLANQWYTQLNIRNFINLLKKLQKNKWLTVNGPKFKVK